MNDFSIVLDLWNKTTRRLAALVVLEAFVATSEMKQHRIRLYVNNKWEVGGR
jgi:hypothetical protein